MLDILLQGSGIHGNKHIGLVARCVYICSYMNLKSRYSAKRTLRGADFCRIVGESRNLVSDSGRHISEDIAGKLHSVAGIAGKSHDYFVKSLYIGFL